MAARLLVANGLDLGITPFQGAEAIAASTLPSHTPSLAALDSLLFVDDGSLTATWSDLAPGATYELYVFGLEGIGNSSSHSVTINGAAAFTNSPTTSGDLSNLWINGQQGDNRPLEDFAVTAIADAVGEIEIVASSGVAVTLGGLAIREVGYLVNSTGDPDDGDPTNGTMTLREAINLSNDPLGADEIFFDTSVFATSQTIDLDSQLPTITDDLTITGPGQSLLTLDAGDGSDNTFATGDGFRIFNIDDETIAEIDVTLSRLTLTGGDTSTAFEGGPNLNGGAISNHENLSVLHSTITGNAAGRGGGISNEGSLNLDSSTIVQNRARNSSGGGLRNIGDATIARTLIANNEAAFGGGIFNFSDANLFLLSSTISGNSSRGLQNYGSAHITGSTITNNYAFTGSGIATFSSAETVTISSSIVAGNLGPGSEIVGGFSESESIIGGDPRLGSLADNGGPTQTHALLPGSPALGAGGGPLHYYRFEGNANDSVGTNNGTNSGSNSDGPSLDFTDNHHIGNDNRGTTVPFQGSIDELAIYDRALTPGEILARAQGNIDQRGQLRYFTGNTTADIGAYEAQITPSADFDSDGDVDGADFLAWQRGFGTANAGRADGNSDDDTDTDASDLAVWIVSYGQPQSLIAAASSGQNEVSSRQSAVGSVVGSDTALIDAAMALEWLDRGSDDIKSDLADSMVFAETYTGLVTSAELVPVSNEVSEIGSESSIAAESQANNEQPELADELLERVFG